MSTGHRMDVTIADVEAAARNAQVGGLYGSPAPCRHSFPNHSVDWRRATCERCGTPIVEIGPLDEEPEP